MNTIPHQKGFTLIEIIIVMSLIVMLLGFIVINLSNIQHSSSLNSSIETMVSDIRSQQNKAMIGATEGRSSADAYGVYFSSNAYTLFHGTIFHSTDSANLVIPIDANLLITHITFPNNSLVFSQLSGEIANYNVNSNSVTIVDNLDHIQKIITVNRYGAIISIH